LTASVALPQDADAMPVDSETVRVGSEAPDFTLEAIDGSQVSLSSYRGKPVVLVFLRGFR
jgi:peroxiredoxin